jgi:hypothetical protein
MFKVGDKVRHKTCDSDEIGTIMQINASGSVYTKWRRTFSTDLSTDLELAEHPAASSGAQREKLNSAPYDLVPFQEITDAYVRVAEKGAVKYAAWNWSKGLSRVQLVGSLLRHTFAYLRGEDRDKETGLMHTDHILWNAVALSHNVHWNLEDGRRIEPDRDYKNTLDMGTDFV